MEKKGKSKKAVFPGFRSPMLAVLTKDFFDDPDWIYERKLDGVRCLIVKKRIPPHSTQEMKNR
ncbi:MAG TPA: hypothetical protein VFD35_12315 [Pricia sp.]|nr:hypothetical protein [Pricia sp.]